jgi:glycosyltransferase involved in cell wall biosynthesis
MNILIVNHYAIPPDQPGGTRHFSLARALVARGHQVIIAASAFDHLTRTGSAAIQDETWDEVRFLRLPTPPYQGNGAGRLWNMLAFARSVRTLLPGHLSQAPDVVVGSSPHPFAAQAALRLSRRMGSAFLLEIRDVWPQSLVEVMGVSPHHPLVWLLGRIERRLYREADHIVTLLPRVGPRVAARGGDPGAITWVPNGVDLAMVPAPQDPPARDVCTFLYAGAHGVTNALEVLLDAAALLESRLDRLPQRPAFVFLGTGPRKPDLLRRARELRLSTVTFLDPVPKREVYGLLTQADAYWVSARDTELWEQGISFNKLYDFMAMARPTLIGMRCSTCPILLSGGGITVAPGDPLAMARGVERMIEAGSAGRREMGLKARAYVERHFDVRRLAETFESALVNARSLASERVHAY